MVGLRTFATAVAKRGWSVNMDKTVCGVGYHAHDVVVRDEALAEARPVFDGVLPSRMVQAAGQVLLGEPL